MKSTLRPRIVTLEPMRVASCRAVGREPEIEAFRVMTAWAREAGVLGRKGVRYFGFDNPAPTSGRDEYGYEVWMTVDSAVRESENVKEKDFPGGKYAVITTRLSGIAQSWKDLLTWRAESEYGEAKHQCLEEVRTPPLESPPGDIEIDLYLPLK